MAIIYIIKANIILALLCLLFQVLMHRDTFFGVRRLMLWGIYLTAFLLPLWNVQGWLSGDSATNDVAEAYAVYVLPTLHVTAQRVAGMGITQSEPGCGMWFVGTMALWALIYIIPVAWMTAKLIFQIAYIIYLRCTCRRIKGSGTFYYFPRPCSPFSFGPWIFVHTDGMDEQTLREVLTHEQTHARQWHTADILTAQLVCILFWWNPAAWVMRREVRMNLEFIADAAVIGRQTDKREYQYRLLGFSTQTNVATIANNFNVLPLKRRITMMNLRRTRRTGMLKYILFVPVAAALLLAFNIDALARTIADKAQKPLVGIDEQIVNTPQPEVEADTCLTPIDPETLIILDGQQMSLDEFKSQPELRAENIESASIIGSETAAQIYGEKGAKGAVVIERKQKELDDKVYEVVEVLPEYPGGQEGMYRHFMENLHYPAEAQEYGVQGRVMVSFVVEKDGTLTDIKAVKATDINTKQTLHEVIMTAYDPDKSAEENEKARQRAEHEVAGVKALKAAAERAVASLPERWQPGKDKGKPVRVLFNLPVTFRLQ